MSRKNTDANGTDAIGRLYGLPMSEQGNKVVDTGHMTKKDIKAAIERLESEKRSLCNRYSQTARYQLIEARIAKSQRELHQCKMDWIETHQTSIGYLDEKIVALEDALKNPKKKRKSITDPIPIDKVHPKIAKYWEACRRAYGTREVRPVIWQSEDGNYAIIHIPGGTGWSGTGQTSYYATEFNLIDTNVDDIVMTKPIAKHEGRFKKAIMEEWIELTKTLTDGQQETE